mgnify:CR=1 FL=1
MPVLELAETSLPLTIGATGIAAIEQTGLGRQLHLLDQGQIGKSTHSRTDGMRIA